MSTGQTPLLTQFQIEKRLFDISVQMDRVTNQLDEALVQQRIARVAWDLISAKTRMGIRARALDSGRKPTQSEVEDEALVRCEGEYIAKMTAEQIAESTKAHSNNLRMQADLTRSISASNRAAMELS